MDYQPKSDTDPRPSLTTSLLDRYEKSNLEAKKAGKPSLASTDMVAANDGEFRAEQGPAGIRNDARSVQKRTWEAHGGSGYLPTTKYAPSGRL